MTKANLSYVALLASIVLMCIAGCEEGGTNADPNGTLKCVTGEFNDCVMDDGSTGVKRCIDSYWGACSSSLCKTPDQNTTCKTACNSDGVKNCGADNLWTACAAPEVCNGLDDDCDNQMDEDLVRQCYCGSIEGTETCSQGSWTACSSGTPDMGESCDGLDNDCDGAVDEDVTKVCYCGTTEGEQKCTGIDQWGPCSAGTGEADEICDGVDNDCDGKIDEDLSETICGLGECETTVLGCVDGQVPKCSPPAGSDEVCGDAKDNDCDGAVDETPPCACQPDAMEECGVNVGECSIGTKKCGADQTWGACSGQEQEEEICDGKDNDCDGDIDEGNPGGGAECGDDVGECKKGLLACVEGKVICQGAGAEIEEVCDGKDNDCSGVADDNLPADQWEANESCGAPRDMGKLQENAGELAIPGTLYKPDGSQDSDWYKIQTDELEDIIPPCGLWPPVDVCYVLEINLQSPAGANFDLCASQSECGGDTYCADDEGAGGADQVVIGWEGVWGDLLGILADDVTFFVEVKPHSGTANECKDYGLSFNFYDAGCPPCPWN